MGQQLNQYEEAYRLYKVSEELKKRKTLEVLLKAAITKPWRISQFVNVNKRFKIVDENGVCVAEAESREIANLIIDAHNVNILLGVSAEELHNEPR